MPLSKRLADLITWARALMALLLVWLGIAKGTDGLPAAVILAIANWTTDSIDGPLARRNPSPRQSWIGRRDLEIDMFFSSGLLAYMTGAGIVTWQITLIYLLLWLVIFWQLGLPHVLGVLYQAPIYGWFIWVALRELPQVGLWIVGWLVVAIAITWPKFPKVIVPDFLNGIKRLFENRQRRN